MYVSYKEVSLFRGAFPYMFTISAAKNIVRYSKDFVRGSLKRGSTVVWLTESNRITTWHCDGLKSNFNHETRSLIEKSGAIEGFV